MPISLKQKIIHTGLGLILAAAGPAGGASPTRPMTVDDLMAIRGVFDARISPDGTRVAYVVSRPNLERNLHDSDIWLAAAAGGDPVRLTRGPGRDDYPRWSPDGNRIAFVSDRGGRPQIWIIAPGGGEAAQLTHLKGGAGGFTWSPDGQSLAILLPESAADTEARDKPPSPRAPKKSGEEVIRPGKAPPRMQIHLIDTGNGACRALTRGSVSVESLAWSPEGDRIVFSARPTTRVPDLFNSDLYVIEILSGAVRKLVVRPGPDTSPSWSPDGRTIAFTSTDTRMEWIANWSICLVPAAGGNVRNLTRDFDEFITACTWSADSRRLFFQANRGVTTQLFAVKADSGSVEPISSGRRSFAGFSFSRDTRSAAFTVSDPRLPDDVHVSGIDGFRPVRLAESNPQLEGIELGSMEIVTWQGEGGLRIEGVLLKPVGFETGRRYPMLVYVHGGPSGKFAYAFSPQIGGGSPLQGETYPLQVLAGKGFAVLMPNPRGSYGYGEKFRMANVRDWGGGDFRDIMAGIDAMIERGVADPERLGIMGRSYGGYMTAWAITQTERFKAASLGAGMCNLVSFWGQTDIPGYMEYYFGGDIWKARDLYMDRSPLTHARRVTTPTLITHGEKDPRVPLPQAREYHHALQRSGAAVDLVIYPRQGHMIREPRLERDALNRNLLWFVGHLLDK